MSFKNMAARLEAKIVKTYTEGITLDEAEKLAAESLHAMLAASSEIKKADLDARMRKSGVKAIKAAVYMSAIDKADKKPTEAMLESIINSDDKVGEEQDNLDKAEVERDELERYYNTFRECHIYARGIGRGKFD